MDIGAIDFRLLTIFDALEQERSVTQSATRLGMSQPAVSQGLAKLRQILGDPLFVRSSHGMASTPRAVALVKPVRDLLHLGGVHLAQTQTFIPGVAQREFTICTSDLGMAILLPKMIAYLSEVAPGVRIRPVPVVAGQVQEELETGRADLVFGVFSTLGAGIYKRRLCDESYVGLAGKHSMVRNGRISLSRFRSSNHILVTSSGTGHGHGAIEKRLLALLPAERIIVRVPNFLAAPLIAADTDCLVTVPRRLATIFSDQLGLRIFKLPIVLPKLLVHLYWHRRIHYDPASRWLRDVVAEVISMSDSP